MKQNVQQKPPLADLGERRDYTADAIMRARQRVLDDQRILTRLVQLEQENKALLRRLEEVG